MVYTSGTTGNPKGVRISRRSVRNRLEWMWRDHPFTEGAVLAVQKSVALVASPGSCWAACSRASPRWSSAATRCSTRRCSPPPSPGRRSPTCT
ncbi:AMP-binding protein [Streptomyces cinnamoneus]|uniref:AMP-binding protein n=1 Tax=Streptomyces cinnamoneus TaxID=53446 RepID=UPI003B968E41